MNFDWTRIHHITQNLKFHTRKNNLPEGAYTLPGGGMISRATSLRIMSIYLTWRWHDFACHLFAHHVILIELSVCGKLCRIVRAYTLPGGGMISRATSSRIMNIYLTWRWHDLACHFFAHHVILIELSVCGKLCRVVRAYTLPGGGMISRATSSRIMRIYLTWRWYDLACHLFAHHVILIELSVCGKLCRVVCNSNF
ncbi:hypothetical protein V1477_008311 [Vespula maculifrons]|uniref:Uncharacterized protein n=1 Tax=Vespula maculifrons TaxID=7453 RepID=A0ABD2CCP0_VESMC